MYEKIHTPPLSERDILKLQASYSKFNNFFYEFMTLFAEFLGYFRTLFSDFYNIL